MSVFNPKTDKAFSDVFDRADKEMYENKTAIKSRKLVKGYREMEQLDIPISDERKRRLDGMFGALLTVSGGGYVYLCDMKYDFSRWSLSLVDDFGLKSEYMYHADIIWQDYLHPDDLEKYRAAVEGAIRGEGKVSPIHYRAKRADGNYVSLSTRAFILSDKDGNPDYFGGIIIQQ